MRHEETHPSLQECGSTALSPVCCRCPPPERIVINYAVRGLIGLLTSSGRPLSSHHSRQAAGGAAGASANRHSMSRSGSRALQTAFGRAAGSTSNLPGLNGGASPAPHAAVQQSSSQQSQQQQGSAAATSAAGRQGSSHQASSLLGRAASSASTGSFDAVAASAAAAGTSGLPGVAEGSIQGASSIGAASNRTGGYTAVV